MAKVVHTLVTAHLPGGDAVVFADPEDWGPLPGSPYVCVSLTPADNRTVGYQKGDRVRFFGVPFSARIWVTEEPDAGQ